MILYVILLKTEVFALKSFKAYLPMLALKGVIWANLCGCALQGLFSPHRKESPMKVRYLTHSLLVLLFVVLTLSEATFASAATPNRVGKITEYSIPTKASFPEGITAGPDGNLWFTEFKGHKIGRMTPGGTFTEFPVKDKRRGPLA